MSRRTLAALLLGAAVAAPPASGARLPTAPRCDIFPATNVWNKRVDSLPVAGNSDAIVTAIGAGVNLHADFGSGTWQGRPIGIPITVVGKKRPRRHVRFAYADESDRGPYPVSRQVRIEGGWNAPGDRHALIVDRDSCKLYELFALHLRKNGTWRAGSGAIWNLGSNRLRPAGWTSADAAGLPILPGLARYAEVKRGVIDHALRFTVERTRRAYIYPARHHASDYTAANLPPMGLRFRLRADFPVQDYPKQARVILVALQRYGMIVADNGSSWYVSGAPNAGWDNDQLHSLHGVHGSDFEVVDTSGLRNG
jgi:hypothetical protein